MAIYRQTLTPVGLLFRLSFRLDLMDCSHPRILFTGVFNQGTHDTVAMWAGKLDSRCRLVEFICLCR